MCVSGVSLTSAGARHSYSGNWPGYNVIICMQYVHMHTQRMSGRIYNIVLNVVSMQGGVISRFLPL